MNSTEDMEAPYAAMPSSADIEALNALAKAEMAAVKSYAYALRSLKTDTFIVAVEPILAHHEDALAEIRLRQARWDTEALDEMGFWGTMATALQRVASTLGERACLTILEEGEHHGVTFYRDTAERVDDPGLRAWIEGHLVEEGRLHRGQLDALVWAMRHGADPREERAP